MFPICLIGSREEKKNDMIMQWRMELSCYNFDIVYRPGKENILPDNPSRRNCNAMNSGILAKLHQALCHLGVTRICHFVKS